MPQDSENTTEMTTQDLQLQKLGDIEGLLSMMLQHENSEKGEIKDSLELIQQLVVKLIQTMSEEKTSEHDTMMCDTLKEISEKMSEEQKVSVTLKIV